MRSYLTYALAALAVAVLTWVLVASPRIELSETKLEHVQERLANEQRTSSEHLNVIQALSEQLSKTLVLEQKNREMLAQIAQQSRAQNHALQELKRNDETIFDYLRQPVPAELGSLYQRPATTDPSTYRATDLSAGAMHSAGARTDTDK